MTVSHSACVGLVCLAISAGPAPAIELGDPAPPVQAAAWVKGKPVNFRAGRGKQMYVVEFWATTCGPCRAAIPHLTEWQKKYADQGVVIIGITNEQPSVVKPFLEKMGDKMDYVVAVDREFATYFAYMKAFGQNGIPHAFIVDKQGRLAWHGHPARGLEETIGQILDGKYDIKAAKQAEATKRLPAEYFKLVKTFETAKSDKERMGVAQKARVVGLGVLRNGMKDADLMDDFASKILALTDPKSRDLDLAAKAAKAAFDASKGTDVAITQTYAQALFEIGRKSDAVKYQKKAIELAKDEDEKTLADMKTALAKYEQKDTRRTK